MRFICSFHSYWCSWRRNIVEYCKDTVFANYFEFLFDCFQKDSSLQFRHSPRIYQQHIVCLNYNYIKQISDGALFEATAISVCFTGHFLLVPYIVFFSLQSSLILRVFGDQMKVAMIDGLSCFFSVLAKDLIFYFIDFLQFATHLMCGHEEIDGFDFCEILQFLNFSA